MRREGSLPLLGKRIVVTRPGPQAQGLIDRLTAAGATAVHLPVVRIVPPGDREALLRAAKGASGYDWIVFPSANAVDALLRARDELGLGLDGLAAARVAAVGAATAEAAAAWGLKADLVPGEFVSESLIDALHAQGVEGKRVLIPRSEEGREILVDGLRAAGARVDAVAAYRTEEAPLAAGAVRAALQGGIDGLTFASPSAVKAFRKVVERAGLPWPPAAPAFCIGPVTAEEAERQGVDVAGIAHPHTSEGLLQAVLSHFGKGG